jgi:hypothetical protein
MKNGSNVIINNLFLLIKGLLADHDEIHLYVILNIFLFLFGHLEIRTMKIKEANLFNTVGCCI